MSSPLGINLKHEKKSEEKRGQEMSSTWHEPVYHAAHRCQAASLSLTAAHVRGQNETCQVESQKTAGIFARLERLPHQQRYLSHSAHVLVLCSLKDSRLITAVVGPHGKDDPDPHVGKRSYRYGMAFAFRSFALIILLGPRFTLRRLPGKLMQRIAQR